jgi:phage terminase large subunit-like protein
VGVPSATLSENPISPLYPTNTRPDQKIDVAVALMMAVGRIMVENEQAKGLERFLSDPIF